MPSQNEPKSKRTYYSILQVSEDADLEAINAAYERLKSKYEAATDISTRSELMFVNNAYATLSDPTKRLIYDKQSASFTRRVEPSFTVYDTPPGGWLSGGKATMIAVAFLSLIGYGLYTRHIEESGKISVTKDAVTINGEVSKMGAETGRTYVEGSINNRSMAIDRSSEIAQRQLDIQWRQAENRRLETENRIRVSEEAQQRRLEMTKAAEEKKARCQYIQSLINQANQAGLYDEARRLRARGC